MHLSDDDRAAVAEWSQKTSHRMELPFPDIDRRKAFLKRKQIGDYIRGLKYYVTCNLGPLVSYAVDCLTHRGNAIGNVWGSAYVLDIGDYDIAYAYKAGHPVKNITIAFPFHEKLYNLVLWGERRAIDLPVVKYQWLKLANAKAFTWLSKVLPNNEPIDFKDTTDWRGINFLKYTIADFRRVLSSVVLDEFMISPQKMLYTYGVLSGGVVRVKADARHSVYHVALSDGTDVADISVGFSGCKFPAELKEGDHIICLCNAFILSTVPYAVETYLVDESESKSNSAIGFSRFRKNTTKSDFVETWGPETLEKLRNIGVISVGTSIEYNPSAYDPSKGYKAYDPIIGKIRIRNVHRHASDFYSLKKEPETLYLPVTDILSPLPDYLRLAGDLFYNHGFSRGSWKHIYEFSTSSNLSEGESLPCATCPIKLTYAIPDKSTKSDLQCIVWQILKRLTGTSTTGEFTLPKFDAFLRSRNRNLLISYDQGDMVIRRSTHATRVAPGGEVIGFSGFAFGEECEDLVEEFISGPRCPFI